MGSPNLMSWCTRTIVIILFILATLSEGDGATDKRDLISYLVHNPSRGTQKPRICQIYSRSTQKHIQIFGKKVVAWGDHGNEYSKLEKTSMTFGVVTIRGIKSNRYLCMSRKGKLVARKKLSKDGSCLFIENITSAFWTSFRSQTHGSWYVGFNHKNGKPKKGRKTNEHQEACNFLVRGNEHTASEREELPESLKEVVDELRQKLRQRNGGLSRRRRHRFQTEDPIDNETSDFTLPEWIQQPPVDAPPEVKKEWIVRVQSVIDNIQTVSPHSNSTMSSFEIETEAPATSEPDKPSKRRNRGGKRNNRARSPKRPRSGRGRNKRKIKIAYAGHDPTISPSGRKLVAEAAVPKTPIHSHGGELLEPPTVASPSFHNRRNRRSRSRSHKSAAVFDNTEMIRESMGRGVIINTNSLNKQIKTNVSFKDDNSRTITPDEIPRIHSPRLRNTRHRREKGTRHGRTT